MTLSVPIDYIYNFPKLRNLVEGIHCHLKIPVVSTPARTPRVSAVPIGNVSTFVVVVQNIFSYTPSYNCNGVLSFVV